MLFWTPVSQWDDVIMNWQTVFSQSNDGIICKHFKECFWHYLSVFSTRNQNHIWITTGARIRMLQGIFLEYPFLHCVSIMMKLKLFLFFWTILHHKFLNSIWTTVKWLLVIVHCTHGDCKLITLIVSNYKLHYHKVRGENTSYSFIIHNYLTFPN